MQIKFKNQFINFFNVVQFTVIQIIKYPLRLFKKFLLRLLNLEMLNHISTKIDAQAYQLGVLNQINAKIDAKIDIQTHQLGMLSQINDKINAQTDQLEIFHQEILHQINNKILRLQQNMMQQLQGIETTLSDVCSEQKYQQVLLELLSKMTSLFAQMQIDFLNHQTLQIQHKQFLVSIIMPVWNREKSIIEAINSILAQTYPHWELLIVDDGSIDHTKHVIEPYLKDRRIHYFYQKHAGVSAARNFALAKSKGEIIAYLDSDHVWFPHVLTIVVNQFLSQPNCQAVYFAAIWQEHVTDKKWINFPEKLVYDDKANSNDVIGINMNCFMHRRKLYEQWGGFDTNLGRLADDELICRYQRQVDVVALPFIGTLYHLYLAENANNYWYNLYLIHTKHRLPKSPNHLRVLYVVYHYPQLTESYIFNEIEYMRRQGVYIEVWTERYPSSPFPTNVKIHKGLLKDAITQMQPDLIHSHWLHTALKHVDEIAKFKLYLTIRGHGYEFSSERLRELQEHPAVYSIHIFNHFYQKIIGNMNKLKSISACFNPQLYFPSKKPKNKKLVLRVAAALYAKELDFFIRVAARCKNHHFVLVMARTESDTNPHYPEEMVEYNRCLGEPVEIHIDMLPDEISQLVHEAGIYLHTHLDENKGGTPYGMPVSISEAMATGAYIIGRSCEASIAYIGDKSQCYSTEDEAIKLINATLEWSEEEWHIQQQQAIDRAYQYFVDEKVLQPILNDWIAIKNHVNFAPTTTSREFLTKNFMQKSSFSIPLKTVETSQEI